MALTESIISPYHTVNIYKSKTRILYFLDRCEEVSTCNMIYVQY